MSNIKNMLTGTTLLATVTFVSAFEGVKYEAYQDPRGIWTICYGETLGVKKGDKKTKAECNFMLIKSLIKHNAPMNDIPHQLPPRVHVAAVSLSYNIGTSGIKKTNFYKHLQNKEYTRACDSILNLKYMGKKDCSVRSNNCYGIWLRRLKEKDLCYGKTSLLQLVSN